MKIYVSHASSFDYENELYALLEAAGVLKEHELILPHRPAYVDAETSEIIKQSDMILAEVSFPSTGQGIELGRADENNVPIFCVHQAARQYSSSLRFIAKDIKAYEQPQELAELLHGIVNMLEMG